MQKDDFNADAWMTMGISTRLALRMGYHRDPRHLPSISPFEGEMRRRTFYLVETFDLLLSFQAGLPAIVNDDDCDTIPPSNLFDEDFDEDCKVLPPSRPPTDSTPMLYYQYKGQSARILKRVVRHALSPKVPLYEDTLKVDGALRENHAGIPPSLRMRPICQSFADPVHLILDRLHIELVYLKSICVLHRYYISHGRSNPAFEYSRKACCDAAYKILKYQAQVHDAVRPSGQFSNDGWMISSLTLNDFLLAAMVACLDLYESYKDSPAASPENLVIRAKKYDALQVSRAIWESRKASSRDARRASNMLAVMLSKVPRPNVASSPINDPQKLPDKSQTLMNGNTLTKENIDIPGSFSWNSNTLGAPGDVLPLDPFTMLEFRDMDPLNTIFNESDNIDWVRLGYMSPWRYSN